ncbi:MAG: glutamate synthase small chain [Frankiaceae bacterium]|nr:glutamate synthase small chain [Frankiaceae bacterium]
MADPTGFLKHRKAVPERRPVGERLHDWHEVYKSFPIESLQTQATRCMDCGIPFCHNGCPLGNIIPEWNDLARRGAWDEAIERLHATNNFPEFTGKLCPAPCEAACVLGIADDPVTIKQIEVTIIEQAWERGLVAPVPADESTGKRLAVIGSGPAGLAAAQQLTRAGHEVVVYERADRIGGLLRYGIPEFKMEKRQLDRRLAQMEQEGTKFVTSCTVGEDVSVEELEHSYDAVVLAVGSTVGRQLPAEGHELDGIHLAMEYLTPSNQVQEGTLAETPISAAGKHVVIIGGGDTGADCLGTALRQGAASVTQLEIMPRPPEQRSPSTPWPTWPLMYRTSSAHEEGGERLFAVSTQRFTGDDAGHVRGLDLIEVESKDGRFEPIAGTERQIAADLVLLAMGFTGPEPTGLLAALGVELDNRGAIVRSAKWETTQPGVFVCGDAGRGQSLIVWAIAEGRACAAAVDESLMGASLLPVPITPTMR